MLQQPSQNSITFDQSVNDSDIRLIMSKIYSYLTSPVVQDPFKKNIFSVYFQKMLIFDDALTGDNRCTIINNFFMELKQIPSNNAAQLTRGDIETRLNNVYSQFISQSQSHYSIVIPSKILYTSISNSSFTIKNVTINVIQSNSID